MVEITEEEGRVPVWVAVKVAVHCEHDVVLDVYGLEICVREKSIGCI